MAISVDPTSVLAFAVYELRLLLAGHLGVDAKGDAPVHAAARLSYALHNQALAVLEGRSFDTGEGIEAISRLDRELGENFVQRLAETTRHTS
jgi:hypothetical protein